MSDDLISRQAAIDELRDYLVKDVQFGDELTAGYNDGIDMAIATISKISSAQPEQHWTPCSERLPEDGQQVLIQMLFGKMSVIKFCATGLTAHIVAWMPLPAPYEERRTDGRD